MKLIITSFFYITSVLCLAACGDSGESSLSRADELLNDEAAVARGRSLFIGTCAGYCHKVTPEQVDAPFLFDCEWRHGGSDNEIYQTVTNGVPDTRMIGFGTNFPEGEEDLWRIIAYLKANRRACS